MSAASKDPEVFGALAGLQPASLKRTLQSSVQGTAQAAAQALPLPDNSSAPSTRANRTSRIGQQLADIAGSSLRRAGNWSLGLILPALIYGLWSLTVARHWIPEQILPPPQLVWQSFAELWASGELLSHLSISASRVAWSLLIGGGGGLILGLAMGLSKSVRAYLYPSFEVVSQFPVLGWIPLLIIFIGIDEGLKIAAISLAVVVPVAVNALKGVANIPRAWLEVGQVYRFSLPQVVTRIVLPAAAPSLFNGLRQGVMQAWLSLVFVELLASSEGIGYLMVWGRQLMQMDLVIVGMLVIGVVGVTLDLALRLLEARVQSWMRSAS